MKPALIVLGATGIVGQGVVQAALDDGWPVIAVAREAHSLDKLRRYHPAADLTVLSASVASDADATRLGDALRALGRPLAGVVAAVCGGAKRGRLLDQPSDFLRRTLDEDLLPHLVAARHLLPLLADSDRGGGYVLIGGPGGENPWAGYGHDSIAAAALRMLARVLHDEARAYPVRVQLLAVDSPLRTDANRKHACTQWPNALAIGRRALALVGRSASAEPAQAVVRYAASAMPASPWSDDIDAEPISGGVDNGTERQHPLSPRSSSTALPSTASFAETPASTATTTASPQLPDSEAPLLTARCLQDARTLLKTLTSPNPHQEPSPR